MNKNEHKSERAKMFKTDWLIAAGFAVASSVLYFSGMANFAYPGESAHLMAVWRGLDVTEEITYPLMSVFAKLFGGGNLLAPICGVISVVSIFLLVALFARLRIGGENRVKFALPASRIAAVTTALIFMLTPAIRAAATHLEPRLFSVAWAAIALLPFLAWCNAHGTVAKVYPVLIGFLWGLGAANAAVFILLLPLLVAAVLAVPHYRGRKPYAEGLLFLGSAALAFIFLGIAAGGLTDNVSRVWDEFANNSFPKGWAVIFLFATVSFVVSLFSSNKAYNEESGWVQWVFHIAMGLCPIVMLATPLAPSRLMAPHGIFPCFACLYVSCVAGYLLSYWWLLAITKVRLNESHDEIPVAAKQHLFAYICGGILLVIFVFTSAFNLFTFDSKEGAFADRMAAKILDDLGDRAWYVSDGSLDDHLRLVAAERGQELIIVSLSRDLDADYLDRLAKIVREKRVGGLKNRELSLSLSLGVLPFVQDWFAADPSAAKNVAIFGAPDLWYSANLTPVPEFVFFGADSARTPDWSSWKEFNALLEAPKGWGSYRLLRETLSPAERLKFELRRHLGFVANNRGVWLQDQGRDDEAFEMYTLVLDEIDSDNICALFNLFEMANANHPKAAARKHEYERRLKAVVDDANRRYRLWSLSNYYGYIRNPGIFIRLGFSWARSGRPGEALQQIKRAIDLVPTDRRNTILNMMAALYASEDDRAKSREAYEKVLAQNANDHDALIGMMRLSLADGDQKKALAFLDRATKAGGDDPRIKVELAMAALMRNDLKQAKTILAAVTEADAADLRAWSLLAAVTMQQCDVEKDPKAKKALDAELEEKILPAMEKQARDPNDYYVQTTRAFILMRKGEDKRREARDAFVVAAQARPDVTATRDIVLGLDISLNDTEAAERHARETLRTDRKNPIANYVMGALALKKGDYDEAAQYLHKSADANKPVVLAMNDLAEVYRRKKNYPEAEKYARMAIKAAPDLYVCYETLGTVLVEKGGDLAEAQKNIEKAVELSTKDGQAEDIRMLISLARVELKAGDKRKARVTLRKVESRIGELSEFERIEYDELSKKVQAN